MSHQFEDHAGYIASHMFIATDAEFKKASTIQGAGLALGNPAASSSL